MKSHTQNQPSWGGTEENMNYKNGWRSPLIMIWSFSRTHTFLSCHYALLTSKLIFLEQLNDQIMLAWIHSSWLCV